MTLTLEPSLVADCLVNVFAALGALIVAYSLSRSDPWGPVAMRSRWALYLVATLFMLRCLAWSTGSGILLMLTDMVAAVMPLAALILAEGLLRRHAPRWMKVAILGSSLAAIMLALLPGVSGQAGALVLLAAVAGGVGCVIVLFLTRDRASLTKGENASIDRIVLALLLLTPLIATDFRSLWPDGPVRFGAIGALFVLFFAFGPASASASSKERLASLIVFGGIATLFAFGYVAAGRGGDLEQLVRAAAVGLSGLIFAALFSELLGVRAERRKAADPLLDSQTADEFEQRLTNHTVVGNARILQGDEIEHLKHPGFDALIDQQPILKRAEAPWGLDMTDDGVERVQSLLTASEATHAMRLSRMPLRLAVFCLPASATDARMESELRAAQRIGELLFERGVRR